MRAIQAISVHAAGVTHATTISTSVGGAIPGTSVGTRPKMVRFAATAAAYVRLGPATTTATNANALVLPGDPLILEVAGNTHYAVIDDGVACKVNVTPLEDS